MGKRKFHAQTYFQCDWTGMPMRHTNCYMPSWNEDGVKLIKHGSYSCWESVVAHAEEMHKNCEITDWMLTKVKQHIDNLVGCTVQTAPHWKELAWFSRDGDGVKIASPAEFLDACSTVAEPVLAVRVAADGSAREILCSRDSIKAKFMLCAEHLTPPAAYQGTPQCFQTVHKKGAKERDITVFYWPLKNGMPFNQTASSIFKMQIYGDCIMVQQTKEPCFLPRERYVSFTLTSYNEQFVNSRKRKEAGSSLTSTDYKVAKLQMASELQQVEAQASASASLPGEVAKASVLERPTGKELASLLLAQGHKVPKKKPPDSEVPQLPLVAKQKTVGKSEPPWTEGIHQA
jgi:hypothetical protein